MTEATTIPNPLLEFSASGVHFEDEADLRNAVAAWLRKHEGLRSSGLTESAYEELIFPVDRPAWRRGAADSMYSCALRFRAALYHLGVRHPLIACPYEARPQMAVADLATVARHYKALYEGLAASTREPREGDALCSIGGAGPHVSCVVSAIWDTGPDGKPALVLGCVDGGGGHKGDMSVGANMYLWQGGAIRDVEPPRSLKSPGARRPLRWTIDLWAIVVGAGLLDSDPNTNA